MWEEPRSAAGAPALKEHCAKGYSGTGIVPGRGVKQP